MSAKETIKRIVDSFNSKPLLRDKTREMGEGLMLGASLADDANELSKDVQAQVDQLVVEGDSSVEAAQARVDASGKTYTTLKKRLDEKEQETTAQFQQIENEKASINYVDAIKMDIAKGGPKDLFLSKAALLAEYPQGPVEKGTYLVMDSSFSDGAHSFMWSTTTSKWEDLGVYQATAIAKRSLTNAQLADKVVTIGKTDFVKIGKNKINSNKLATGYYGTDGLYYANDTYRFTELIPVTQGEVFVFSRNINLNTNVRERASISFITAYSMDVVAPNSGGRNVNRYVVPPGIDRIRVSTGVSTFERELQMELGEEVTSFEKYKRSVDNLHTDIDNNDIAEHTIDTEKLRLPEKMLPYRIYFTNGALESGVFNPVSSNRVSTEKLQYANKGSQVVVTSSDVEFSVHLLTSDGNYISNTGWTADKYTFVEDSYFRISQRYKNEATVPKSNLFYFNKSIFISPNKEYSVALKNDLNNNDLGMELILPYIYPVVVGKQAQVYLDNILRFGNYYKAENFKVRNRGNIVAGGYQFTLDVNRDLNFDYHRGKQLILTKKMTAKAVDVNAGSNQSKKVLMIGESTTDNVGFISEIINLFENDVMNIEFLGTRGSGPALHEGRSGWKVENFISSQLYKDTENAFYNTETATFDFVYYMNQQGYDDVDIVCINFGLNDIDEGQTSEQIIQNYKKIITRVRAFNPEIKIGIGLTNLPSKHENMNGTDLKNKLLSLIAELIDTYGNRENEGFYLIPIYLNVDPLWDMRYAETVISERNPRKITIGTDLVHPSEIGYLKSSDVHFNVFKYMFQ